MLIDVLWFIATVNIATVYMSIWYALQKALLQQVVICSITRSFI